MKLNRVISKTLSLILVFAMVIPMFVFAANEPWDISFYQGRENDGYMVMQPEDGYVSTQNPPAFFWGRTDSYSGGKYTLATYDLQISKDDSFSDIVYSKTNLTDNSHLPSKTLSAGVPLYWRVRYHFNGSTSTWSTVRKFKISDNSINYNLPSKDVMLSKIPTTHPRIWTTKDDLSEFRNYKNTSKSAKEVYDVVILNADRYVSENKIYDEPTIVSNPSAEIVSDAHSKANINIERAYWCAFAYLLTGGENYADYAKRAALSFLNWDAVNGYTTSKHNIQITRAIMLQGARVYDWIYDTLTEAEITQFHNMLRPRIEELTVYNGHISKYPLNSMGWSGFSYLLASCIALYNEMPEANTYLNDYIEYFCTRFPNWSYQDGGWSQGTAYSWWSTSLASEFATEMAVLGIANVYENIWGQNAFKWNMYQMPANSSGNFGDGTQQGHNFLNYMLLNNMQEMNFIDDGNNGYRKWLCEQAGGIESIKYSRLDAYYLAPKYDSIKAVAPKDLPLSNHFKDSGVYSMMSDPADINRIHFTLRASDYGTAIHCMQEQNAFFLTAFNKDLAVRSGYYDSYGSPHHDNITRPAFSKNTITVDNEYQIPSSLSSDGKILSFVNHIDFDTATSDAAEAYTNLDNFDRSVIYIRPDIFVIVDELDAKGNNSSVFKWWLNAPVPITDNAGTYLELSPTTSATSPEIAGKKEVRITNDNAVLTAKAVYPATSLRYYKGYVDPITFQEYESTKYQELGIQNRICFNTASLPKTVMVTSLSVFENTGSEKQATVTYYDDYVKLSYLGGETVVLVNITDNSSVIQAEAEGIEFSGTAVTYNENTIMLTNGTYLKKDGKEIVKSSSGNVSVAIGLGEFAISSADAFTTAFGDVSDYVTITDTSELIDRNGVNISSKIGISPSLDNVNGTLTITADGGDYVVLTSEDSVTIPSEMPADEIKFQKSGDGKAAIFWTPKEYRRYDIMLDGAVIYDLSESPYVFDLNPEKLAEKNVSSVKIREKLGQAIGPWSEPVFVSSFDDEKHDVVKFYKNTEGDKTFVNATTTGFPSFDVFNMYLANYDKDGKLTSAVSGEKSGNVYSAQAPLIEDGKHKVFLFGPNIKPLSSSAVYGADDTNLKAIYIDGKPLEGYSDDVDSYHVTIPKGSILFPYLSAVAKDNTTSTRVKYNFDELTAKIYVTSSGGAQRVIDIEFKNTREDIHVVVDPVTGEIPTFVRDTAGYGAYRESNDNREANISSGNVANVTFNLVDPLNLSDGQPTVTKYEIQLPISTNFKPYEGNFRWGSKVFNNRSCYSGNYMQILDVDEDLIGYDYIVPLHNDMFGYTENTSKKKTLTDINVKFKVNQPSEVVIISRTKAPDLEAEGWRAKDVDMQAVYSNPVGAEDWFYNVILCNRPYTDTVTDQKIATSDNQRLDNYTIYKEWINVAPISSVISGASDFASKIQAYMNAGLTKSDFAPAGSCYDYYITGGTTWKYKYTYAMDFPAGDVNVVINHCPTIYQPFLLVVRPKTPKPFYTKDTIGIKTHYEYKGDVYATDLKIKDNLAWLSEAEDYLVPATGVNVYSSREWLSGGKAVQYFRNYGSEMTYNVNVPETGYYNFVVKYTAWGADGLPLRQISFNNNDNKTYTFTPKQTQSYGSVPEDWAACEVDCGIYLKEGANVLTIKALNTGYWNIDWVGLIKK